MAELFLDWLVDTMARTDVIDLYFIVSDLVDIPQSDLQIAEQGSYDAQAIHTLNRISEKGGDPQAHRPMGLRVY